MKNDTLFAILFTLIGLFTLLASALNWDFYFDSRKAKYIVKFFGRKGARIFYAIVGLLLLGIGSASLLGFIDLNSK